MHTILAHNACDLLHEKMEAGMGQNAAVPASLTVGFRLGLGTLATKNDINVQQLSILQQNNIWLFTMISLFNGCNASSVSSQGMD